MTEFLTQRCKGLQTKILPVYEGSVKDLISQKYKVYIFSVHSKDYIYNVC